MLEDDGSARRTDELRKKYTAEVVKLIRDEGDLQHLDRIFSPAVAELYKKTIPRYVDLLSRSENGLSEEEKAELQLRVTVLLPVFGVGGLADVAAEWVLAIPKRQAKWS